MTERTAKFLCMESVMEHLGKLRQEWQEGHTANPKFLLDAMQHDLRELERLCAELEAIPRQRNGLEKRSKAEHQTVSAYVGKILWSWAQPSLSA